MGKGALAADLPLPGGDTLRLVTAHLGVVRFDRRRGAYRETDARARRAQVEELGTWVQGLPGTPRHLVVAGDVTVSPGRAEAGGVVVTWSPAANRHREGTWTVPPCTVVVRELDDPMLSDVWGERLTRLDIDVTALGPVGTLELTVKETR